jgi:hypothetical protein
MAETGYKRYMLDYPHWWSILPTGLFEKRNISHKVLSLTISQKRETHGNISFLWGLLYLAKCRPKSKTTDIALAKRETLSILASTWLYKIEFRLACCMPPHGSQ